ncbi:MAG: response regulator [Actinobacteria bacterium]|uniref:Sensory transduction protein RegX3 n=1 Tax=freshwater metagenome TaxID=449393 RepID=A0A6J5ZU70_9ZZZZ|nr:response regulator [Actinomycetota bacterium]
MDVLLVEDDPSVAASVIDSLAKSGLEITHVDTGAKAIAYMASHQPDIILLDLGLPDMDGQDVCRTIRKTSQVPIIILSARSDEVDRVLALEFGADDYMVKPYGMRELLARIKAVSRRTSAPIADGTPAQDIGPIKVDRRQQKVFVGSEEIHLTPKEFDLLAYLANDPGAVFRRKDIMSDVWGTDWYGTTKTVDAHVASLRKKLGNQEWVEAVRGVGFRLSVTSS